MVLEDVLRIASIIVVAGVMGGTWNALNECADQNKLAGQRADSSLISLRAWLRWSFQGICAAALVPLFLSLVGSELLNKLNGGSIAEAFVFGGFCLIAAISARQFVGTLTDRVLQMAQQAQEQSAAANAKAEDAQAKAEDAQTLSHVAHDKAEDAQATSLAAVDAQLSAAPAPTSAVTASPMGDDDEAPVALGLDAEPAGASADPNKGRFGGAATRDGKQLTASLRALGERPGYMVVQLKVSAAEGSPPLSGDVQFFLHPTFANAQPTVRVVDGVARFTCMSWGAFTVGAVHEGTRLELDLAEHPDAREPWKSR